VALWLGLHTWQLFPGLATPSLKLPASAISQLIAWLLLLPPEELPLLEPAELEDDPPEVELLELPPPPEQAKTPPTSSESSKALVLSPMRPSAPGNGDADPRLRRRRKSTGSG
jgi:hypothetical protein